VTLSVYGLSGYNKFNANLEQRWKSFLDKRQTRLIQEARYGSAAEKVAEDILQDFFTMVLDWKLGSINNQIQYADMVLTHQGLKRLIVEVKRPNSLSWDKLTLDRALNQARKYAQQQRVTTIAVSDGALFYAVDIKNGGLVDRARLNLDNQSIPLNLYWVSVDGIYRPVEKLSEEHMETTPDALISLPNNNASTDTSEELLHPKHSVPARCFAYVGDPSKTSTWKLPYRLMNGQTDEKHLPGAIRAVSTNYRGAHNKSVPEEAISDVLVRLGMAAWSAGKMPEQTNKPLGSYQILHDALYQLGRLDEIKQA
jgi:hypothetical protein